MQISRIVAVACTLAATILVVAPTSTQARHHQAPKPCPQVWEPVCGLDAHGVRLNYKNACLARDEHARILHNGICYGALCMFVVNPVCALDPTTHKRASYPNICAAELVNATWIHDGSCK